MGSVSEDQEELDSTEEPSLKPRHDTHFGVVCDGCEMYPVVGERYKCYECDDYDLCGKCKADGVHPNHSMKWILPEIGRELKSAIKEGDLAEVESIIGRWPELLR